MLLLLRGGRGSLVGLLSFLCVLLVPAVSAIRGLLLPWRSPLTHPEWNARERWIDYLSANPLGKLYNLYRLARWPMARIINLLFIQSGQ